MKRLSDIFFIVIAMALFHSCHKENGKHKYLLTLDFDNYPDNATFECYAFEKCKNYPQSWAPKKDEIYYNKGGVFLANENDLFIKLKLDNGGNKSGNWVGGNYIEMTDESFPINSIPANLSNRFTGTLGLDIEYQKKGNEIIVYNDYTSFTFIWQNAAEYGHTDSVFYGKCSLRRIE